MDNKPYQSIVGGQIVWHHTTPGTNGKLTDDVFPFYNLKELFIRMIN